jgi:hypothetical protein
MAFVPNGSGLQVNEGFAVPDGTGYVLPQRKSGCQATFPGYFRDTFNYTASASGHQTTFGPYNWQVVPDKNATYNLSSNNVRLISDIDFAMYVGCTSFPKTLPNQWSTLLWLSSDYAQNTDGGGPAVYMTQVTASIAQGYWVQLLNTKTLDGSLVTTTPRLYLYKRVNDNTQATLGSYVYPLDAGPPNNNGPLASSHWIGIKATPSGSNLILRAYIDDPNLNDGNAKITYTDTSPLSPGVAGIFFGGHLNCTNFYAGAF